jgi:uncharacterized membrane protein
MGTTNRSTIKQRGSSALTSSGANAGEESEQNVYADVYRLLIVGMVASNILFLIGLVLALLHPRFFALTEEWIKQQYHWEIVRHGLVAGDPNTYMMVATVVLILTPVTRVMISIYAFFVDRDFKYVAVTSFVLLIMVATVVFGFLGLK